MRQVFNKISSYSVFSALFRGVSHALSAELHFRGTYGYVAESLKAEISVADQNGTVILL
jgi:hypothetical protein